MSSSPLKRFHSNTPMFWSRTSENNYLLEGEERHTGPQRLYIYSLAVILGNEL
jgi:hypothetical protein